MKALVLAGGKGTRLRPITHTSAKQLVPVANKPILFYGLESIRDAGIRDVGIIVAGPVNREGTTAAEIHGAVGDGSRFGLRVEYIAQEQPLGLAHAVKTAQGYLKDSPFVMFLGDNLIKDGIKHFVEEFEAQKPDAQILLAAVPHPEEFGVAELAGEHVVRLEEKPKQPRSNLALVGVYMFTPCVFEAVDSIRPSKRGELEITDAIQQLIDVGKTVRSHVITGWWKDTGKLEDLLEANRIVLTGVDSRVEGQVGRDCQVEGTIQVGEGTVIQASRLRGPLVIGKHCKITESYVGPFSAVADGCVIERAEIEHSIVLERSSIIGLSTRIESSLIGRETVVTTSPHRPRAHRLMVGDSSRVEFGA
ncbi:MAG TPA: glucose-1-phosphate thymidylyltransferase [Candidatus Eisenbacteria bacterium]|nr:glucose-1-phosphate thymidylyltransferase [Candidatus Eisenbacteria bacterium]